MFVLHWWSWSRPLHCHLFPQMLWEPRFLQCSKLRIPSYFPTRRASRHLRARRGLHPGTPGCAALTADSPRVGRRWKPPGSFPSTFPACPLAWPGFVHGAEEASTLLSRVRRATTRLPASFPGPTYQAFGVGKPFCRQKQLLEKALQRA